MESLLASADAAKNLQVTDLVATPGERNPGEIGAEKNNHPSRWF